MSKDINEPLDFAKIMDRRVRRECDLVPVVFGFGAVVALILLLLVAGL